MKLEPRDIASPAWQKLNAHYTARLQTLRERNDSQRPETATIALRAEIKSIKEFLAIGIPGEPESEVAADD